MRTLNARPDLEAYLRLNDASGSEWLAAVRELLGCPGMDCSLSRPRGVAGSLSALEVNAGVVCVLKLAQDMEFSEGCLHQSLLVVQLDGQGEMSLQGGCRYSTSPSVAVPAGCKFSLRAGEGSRLALVYPLAKPSSGLRHKTLDQVLADHTDRFLLRSDYFQDHRHASQAATEFFRQLEHWLATGEREVADDLPELDRRLVRVIEKIRGEPAWAFDLQELAQHSGASERNLYYLMKREIGMTPYRFYQRCRLIRVRRHLVDCQCDVPHISRYAADEGFSHLGRFAAMYREHFGELPSETVQWRRRLQEYTAVESPRLVVS